MIRDEAYDLTDHSQGQMLTRAGITVSFAQKLMDLEENELLSRNLKRLTERMEKIPLRSTESIEKKFPKWTPASGSPGRTPSTSSG